MINVKRQVDSDIRYQPNLYKFKQNQTEYKLFDTDILWTGKTVF